MWVWIISVVLILLLGPKTFYWFNIIRQTWKRDLKAGWLFFKLNLRLWNYVRTNATAPKIFSKYVRQHPMKVAFYFEDRAWTFEEVDHLSNQVAAYFYSEGFRRGDCVALLLESRPEYICIWLGLAKLGVITALINTNLVSTALAHSLGVASIKALIYGNDFSKAVADVTANSLFTKKLYRYDSNDTDKQNSSEIEDSKVVDLKKELERKPKIITKTIENLVQTGKSSDPLLYIYTSGTTGLPKAAVIKNSRYIAIVLAVYHMPSLKSSDIFYTALPLYHTAGGIAGSGQALINGMTVVLRRKFSASNFWSDCERYKCTATQYIGEVCRYLLTAHKQNPTNLKPHSIRVMVGNGMRPQLWKEFTTTFNIPQLCEFYGSTEGNANLVNFVGKEGAIGFVPRYASCIYPVFLLRCSEDGTLIKNEKGFCIGCGVNERGLCVGKINQNKVVNEFTGYINSDETNKKILRNVFKSGDMYFNSGDIMEFDELGYYYFRDRIGDTYRWKGENVSTAEVEGVISSLTGLQDAVVYGVEIPGTEGRAGMAALVDTQSSIDINEFSAKLLANLPRYAVPVFIRILDKIPLTGTFKLQKFTLQKEAFHIDKFTDSVYYFNGRTSRYEILTQQYYQSLLSGEAKI